MRIDRRIVFAGLRNAVFGGRLTQGQVEGVEAVLTRFSARGWADPRWLKEAQNSFVTLYQPVRRDGRYLGQVAVEFLALGLDPYPRKPGAQFAAGPEPEIGEKTRQPFASLAALRKNGD